MQRFKYIICQTEKSTMKSLPNSFLIIVLLFIFIPSCKKNVAIPGSIIGKWNIQSDSTYAGAGFVNHLVIYYGQPTDYFNFSTDGHIYTMENSILDTLRFTISSDSVMIPNFGYGSEVGKCQIPSSSIHSIIISSGHVITPGGVFGRTVYLIR